MFRKILLFLLVVFIIIQFFHPKANKSTGDQPNYIGKVYAVPTDVQVILKKACNDCHSNNTRYPWYSNVQPVDWWLNNHIREGKSGLNFDEYTNKRLRYQYGKMDDIIELVKEGGMPLKSYTWIHKDAILTDAEKSTLTAWAQGIMDSLKAKYPTDSLLRRKQWWVATLPEEVAVLRLYNSGDCDHTDHLTRYKENFKYIAGQQKG